MKFSQGNPADYEIVISGDISFGSATSESGVEDCAALSAVKFVVTRVREMKDGKRGDGPSEKQGKCEGCPMTSRKIHLCA